MRSTFVVWTWIVECLSFALTVAGRDVVHGLSLGVLWDMVGAHSNTCYLLRRAEIKCVFMPVFKNVQ